MSEHPKFVHFKYPVELENNEGQKFVLKLYVAGVLQNSLHAIKNITQICEHHLKDNYELEVIDIYQQPGRAISEQIIVVPVMIIKFPLPEKRLIGDLSNTEKVLATLNIN